MTAFRSPQPYRPGQQPAMREAPPGVPTPENPLAFGKYWLVDRLAVGGMAEVYLARAATPAGQRLVAVKRIAPTMAEDEDFIQMFIDEARIAGQLSHPNIVPIYELGKIGNGHYIAMEYVWGKDLLQIVNRFRKMRQAMPPQMAMWIASQMCSALHYAHTKTDRNGVPLDIVHRDISPQNGIVSYDGSVKLIDFGIAKAASRATTTQAGVLKGKFGYMSPEQAEGMTIDRRSDVFAVGTCLWEMLAGDRLFVGENDLATLEKVRDAAVPPIGAIRPDISLELAGILQRALARRVEDRYQSGDEMHRALVRCLDAERVPFSPAALSSWMKTAFAAEYDKERKRIEAALPASLAMNGPRSYAEPESSVGTTTATDRQPVPSEPPVAAEPTTIFFAADDFEFEDANTSANPAQGSGPRPNVQGANLFGDDDDEESTRAFTLPAPDEYATPIASSAHRASLGQAKPVARKSTLMDAGAMANSPLLRQPAPVPMAPIPAPALRPRGPVASSAELQQPLSAPQISISSAGFEAAAAKQWDGSSRSNEPKTWDDSDDDEKTAFSVSLPEDDDAQTHFAGSSSDPRLVDPRLGDAQAGGPRVAQPTFQQPAPQAQSRSLQQQPLQQQPSAQDPRFRKSTAQASVAPPPSSSGHFGAPPQQHVASQHVASTPYPGQNHPGQNHPGQNHPGQNHPGQSAQQPVRQNPLPSPSSSGALPARPRSRTMMGTGGVPAIGMPQPSTPGQVSSPGMASSPARQGQPLTPLASQPFGAQPEVRSTSPGNYAAPVPSANQAAFGQQNQGFPASPQPANASQHNAGFGPSGYSHPAMPTAPQRPLSSGGVLLGTGDFDVATQQQAAQPQYGAAQAQYGQAQAQHGQAQYAQAQYGQAQYGQAPGVHSAEDPRSRTATPFANTTPLDTSQAPVGHPLHAQYGQSVPQHSQPQQSHPHPQQGAFQPMSPAQQPLVQQPLVQQQALQPASMLPQPHLPMPGQNVGGPNMDASLFPQGQATPTVHPQPAAAAKRELPAFLRNKKTLAAIGAGILLLVLLIIGSVWFFSTKPEAESQIANEGAVPPGVATPAVEPAAEQAQAAIPAPAPSEPAPSEPALPTPQPAVEAEAVPAAQPAPQAAVAPANVAPTNVVSAPVANEAPAPREQDRVAPRVVQTPRTQPARQPRTPRRETASTPAATGGAMCTLQISSLPAGATIERDGTPTGRVTPYNLPTAAGAHRVTLRLNGQTRTIPVVCAPGRSAPVRVSF